MEQLVFLMLERWGRKGEVGRGWGREGRINLTLHEAKGKVVQIHMYRSYPTVTQLPSINGQLHLHSYLITPHSLVYYMGESLHGKY